MIFQNFFWHIVSHLTNEWHDYNHQKWWWSWNDPVSILIGRPFHIVRYDGKKIFEQFFKTSFGQVFMEYFLKCCQVLLTDAIFETGASGVPSKSQKSFICGEVGQTITLKSLGKGATPSTPSQGLQWLPLFWMQYIKPSHASRIGILFFFWNKVKKSIY